MFWAFLIATATAIGLIQLGAMSVWITVLKAMLVVVLAVALFVGLLFVWQPFKSNKKGE
ncbi:hypothetical protein [Undibacterium sp.]|uniref:hypothetical protein n=1 Tax=Undibacterium sp. TaxID=1914977 RepID=UPI0027310526|nr:hypothetical protein [Undibacterium sp.]MDP1978700.1 hypothetical protein [Undibacterium sp.]